MTILDEEAVKLSMAEIEHFLSDRTSGYVNGISKQHLARWHAALALSPTTPDTQAPGSGETLAEVARLMAKDICGHLVGTQHHERDVVKIAAYIVSCATRGALAWEGFSDLASPPAWVGEPVPVAWRGYWPGAGSIDSTTMLTRFKSTMEKWAAAGDAEITPLYAAPIASKEASKTDA